MYWIILGILFIQFIFNIKFILLFINRWKDVPAHVFLNNALSICAKVVIMWAISNGSTLAMVILISLFALETRFVDIESLRACRFQEWKWWITVSGYFAITSRVLIVVWLYLYGHQIWLTANTPLNQLF